MQTMLRFAVPMILGDLLQQCYNIADTLIVGRYLGESALAAVGSAFSLMTFLTSIILGLAMGSGTVFSIRYGQKDEKGLKEGILASFALLASVTVILNILVFAGLDLIIWFLRTPEELVQMMRDYLSVSFASAFPGKFRGAPCLSDGVRLPEHRPRPLVCDGTSPGRGRSRGGHGHRPVCIRYRNCQLHLR